MATNRDNVSNKDQHDLEQAEFDSNIAHFSGEGDRKMIAPVRGAAPRTSGPGDTNRQAGVVLPHDDVQNRFTSDQIGRAGGWKMGL